MEYNDLTGTLPSEIRKLHDLGTFHTCLIDTMNDE